MHSIYASFLGFFGDVEEHLIRMLLFVPLGLLVPMLFGRRLGGLCMILMAAVAPAAIETNQLLSIRVTNIDDLLMNAIGALMGYWLFRRIKPMGNECSYEGYGIDPSVAMIATALFGRFFIYDEMGLAKMLLGFQRRRATHQDDGGPTPCPHVAAV